MKAMFLALLAVAAIHTLPASAETSAVSPLLGSWAVDVSRLPIPPTARPMSVTITFSDAGAGRWSAQVDIVDGSGAATHARSTVALDGTPTRVEDGAETDAVAVKLPSPSVLVMDLAKGGIPASTRVYTVAADGKTMIETAAYVGGNGLPVMRTNYFTRVR